MICMELWQFISTEDLANSTDIHPGELGFAQIYPDLINQPVKVPHLYVRSSVSCCHAVTLWHIWQGSVEKVQLQWRNMVVVYHFAGQTQKGRKARKWMKLVESLRWKKRWGHFWMTITDLDWGYWSVTTSKSYRHCVFFPTACQDLADTSSIKKEPAYAIFRKVSG